MTAGREREVMRALLSLADYLVSGDDVVDLFTELTADCARMLDVASCGLLLADGRGVLHVIAASSEDTRDLELFQVQREEGPCLDCFHSGSPVSVPDLDAERETWPMFAAAAAATGFRSVHALPLKLRGEVLGALGLFGASTGALNEDDLALGAALAHVSAVALVARRVAVDSEVLAEQLKTALDTRVLLEQAKGLLAAHGDLDMDQAFRVLRRYARDHNLSLGAVAAALVRRETRAADLLRHVSAKGALPPPRTATGSSSV